MSKKEIVNVITVKTGESQNTIKGLKEEIKSLKKALDDAEIGSEEFLNTQNQLKTIEAELKSAIKGQTEAVDAAEGSYNHLTKTMAELKKEWKATADEVKRNNLAQQIDAINTELKELDAGIGNYQRNVGDYTNSFKDAFDAQQKSTENVRIGLDGLQKTASGLASGYAAVQGTLNLLNIESTEFEKAMIKVQSAMAIAQGIGGMKDLIEGGGTLITVFKNSVTGVKAFIKSLTPVKAAIASTGIGILVVAIGTLIANWDTLTAKLKKIDAFDKLKANVMGVYNVVKTYLLAPFKALGEIISGDFKAGIEEMKQAFKFAENFNIGKIAEQEKQAANAILETAKKSALATENYIKDQEAKLGSDWKYTNEGVAVYRKFYNEKLKLYQKDSEDYKNTQRDLWSFERELKEKNKKTPKEKFVKPKKQSGVLDDINLTESDPYDITRKQLNKWMDDKDAAIAREKEMEIEKIEWMRQNYGDLFAFIQKKGGSSAGLVAAGFMESLYTASSVIGAIQDSIDTTTKEGFEKNKRLQIANAVIQTLVGVTTALSGAFTTKSGPWDIALAAIQASTIAATGAIQVANIRKQTFNGGSEGAYTPSTPSPSVSPRINLGDTMPVQYTRNLMKDSELSNINKEQRVYVLESDISETQNKVAVSQSNSSF